MIREFDGEQEDLVVLVEDVVPELVFAVWLGRGIKKIPERLVVEAHQSARSAYDAAIASGASPCQARRSAVILASLPLLRWIYGHDDWRFLDEDLLWGCAKRWLGR
ncbi:MAG: hypothetical protein IT405_02880 [Candidatus Yanofskybacteria bacterium]|nr:hypothetical protein [Candidatus Yanofskybacteria bacterium]